ncbi:hypothetical protein GCM10027271_03220 [Saccharopolyspora gloriosae]|uniref:Uncharacterized protein n=1 Tax=Saccharopolyspora gloriosae TaxID=455344 RepID=A0A840NRV7_9PSEU|nr:hypothetical protein [Saccharopolyspora gloriosae]MBB5071872.1 hypothetical protein [Saccharopolyspora gloriosae]
MSAAPAPFGLGHPAEAALRPPGDPVARRRIGAGVRAGAVKPPARQGFRRTTGAPGKIRNEAFEQLRVHSNVLRTALTRHAAVAGHSGRWADPPGRRDG